MPGLLPGAERHRQRIPAPAALTSGRPRRGRPGPRRRFVCARPAPARLGTGRGASCRLRLRRGRRVPPPHLRCRSGGPSAPEKQPASPGPVGGTRCSTAPAAAAPGRPPEAADLSPSAAPPDRAESGRAGPCFPRPLRAAPIPPGVPQLPARSSGLSKRGLRPPRPSRFGRRAAAPGPFPVPPAAGERRARRGREEGARRGRGCPPPPGPPRHRRPRSLPGSEQAGQAARRARGSGAGRPLPRAGAERGAGPSVGAGPGPGRAGRARRSGPELVCGAVIDSGNVSNRRGREKGGGRQRGRESKGPKLDLYGTFFAKIKGK